MRVRDAEKRMATLKKIRLQKRTGKFLNVFSGSSPPPEKGTDWSKVKNKGKATILVRTRELILRSRKTL